MVRPMDKLDAAQPIALGSLAVSLVGAACLLWPAMVGREAARLRLEAARAERVAAERAPRGNDGSVVAAEPADPGEPPRFLGLCKRLVAESGCALSSFDLAEASKPRDGEAVWPVRGKLEVKGTYRQARALVRALADAPRLLALAKVEIQRDEAKDAGGRVIARLEIDRYVARVVADDAPAIASAPAPAPDESPQGL
jgi:hypothetical protein